MTSAIDWDVVIVGRSYAGLSTALTLGRARKATMVVGDGGPRNEAVRHIHGLLTRDGADPNELVRIAEDELARYPSLELVDARAHGIEPVAGGFRVRVGPGATTCRFVVLATGVNDNPPPVPGLSEHWGRGVFTCPFCDGYERADRPWAVIGDPVDPRQLAILGNWSDAVTAYAPDAIRRIHGDGEEVTHLELADGSKVEAGAVFVAPSFTPNSSLAASLGCELDEQRFVVVDETRQTTVDGVYAVGDLTSMRHQIAFALADGVLAAATITHRLLTP